MPAFFWCVGYEIIHFRVALAVPVVPDRIGSGLFPLSPKWEYVHFLLDAVAGLFNMHHGDTVQFCDACTVAA